MPIASRSIAVVVWAALVWSAIFARAGAPILSGYESMTLDNGMKVVSLEDFSCPIVNVQVWYHVGSKNERPDRQGFAHMFEHMMFRGTDKLGPTDHFELVRRTGGTCNAYTAFDQTVYHETLPASQLELALWLESERMAFLRIDQASFDTERKVVEEERRLGLNRPYGSVPEKLLPQVFTKHPYQWSPIGQIPHLRAASIDELGAFWVKFYVPNNAALVVAGAAKHKDVQSLAKRYFGWMPRAADPPKVNVVEPVIGEPKSISLEDKSAPVPVVGIGFRTVPTGHPDSVALDMLSTILGGGLGGSLEAAATGAALSGGSSSRLYRELVADTQLAVFAIAGAFSIEQDGLFVAGAALPPLGGKVDVVARRIEAQLERLRTERVSEGELLKARNQLLKLLVTGTLTVDNKARILGESAVLAGDIDVVNREADRIRSITADELLSVAKKYLAPERAYKVTVKQNLVGSLLGGSRAKVDEESAPVAPPQSAASSQANPKNLARPKSFPNAPPVAKAAAGTIERKATTHRLKNGLVVRVVENHETPMVSASLSLRSGAWADTKPGVASMTFGMLTRGTDKHNEAELARELETYAIDLSAAAEMDGASVAFSSLSEHFERAMQLAAEAVRRPTFPANEFEKLKKRTKANLAITQSQPEYLARRELERRLFGEHPYARAATGEAKDVDSLTAADCKAWHAKFVRPDLATLIVAGDVDASTMNALAERAFGDWKVEETLTEPSIASPPRASSTHIYLVDKPGAIQSQIAMGQVAMGRADPAYPASRVVSGYFGGAFNSRLNDAIRVKRGLTYGARGGFAAQRFAGTFIATTFTKTATTAETVRVALDEIDRLRRDGPNAKELDDTKSYTLGAFVRERETPQQVAADLALIAREGLPEDYFERLLAGIEKTGEGDCIRLATATIDPTKLVVVVVGDAKKVKGDMERIAPVTVVGKE